MKNSHCFACACALLLGMTGTANAVEAMLEVHQSASSPQAAPTRASLIAQIGQVPAQPAIRAELTAQDHEALEQRNRTVAGGAPLKTGVVKPLATGINLWPLDVAAMTEQTYSFLGGTVRRSTGQLAWALALDAANAAGVRIRLDDIALPAGAQIFLYNDAGEVRGPYTPSGKQFWTGTIDGGPIYLQVNVPDTAAGQVHFTIGAILLQTSQAQRSFEDVNAHCVLDATCIAAKQWPFFDEAKRAIARLSFIHEDGAYLCTGGLLADRDENSVIPYLLTANHCISDPAVATTVEAWFDYSTASCDDYDSARTRYTSVLGATILDSSAVDDHTLMVLDTAPASEATYLGWNDQPVAHDEGLALYRLSHPQGSPLVYSVQTVDTLSPPRFCVDMDMPRGPYIFSQDQLGATEGGSSGSPVMQYNGQVVGQLFGVCGTRVFDACDRVHNNTVDGAFANYFERVAPWLAPDLTALPLVVQTRGTGEGRINAIAPDDSAGQLPAAPATGKWPWEVWIDIDEFHLNRNPLGANGNEDAHEHCTGTLIAPDWVLTAAHCVGRWNREEPGAANNRYITYATSNLMVRTGSTFSEYGEQRLGLKRIVRHPRFNPTTRDNDIALLELKAPSDVEPVRLVTYEREPRLARERGVITGWQPDMDFQYPASPRTEIDQLLVERKLCADKLGTALVTDRMICTQTTEAAAEKPQIDSGSALIVDNGRGGFMQAGVVNNSHTGEGEGALSTVMRTAPYVGWMQEVTGIDLTSDIGPEMIDCGNTCQAHYPQGRMVRLAATPAPGSTFDGWADACEHAEPFCDVLMDRARFVRAHFSLTGMETSPAD